MSFHVRQLVDLGWARYAEARLELLAPEELRALEEAREAARKALLAAKR